MPSTHFPSAGDGLPDDHTGFGCGQVHSGSSSACSECEPLVDRNVLRELEKDFDSPTVVHAFARDFAQSWDGKYRRLVRFVEDRDKAGAKEAALSVKVTSTMVGAARLAYLAAWFEKLIEANDMDAAARTLAYVEACGSDTTSELLDTYIPPDL
ncbi:hypothetical protein IWX65_001753 [Arthrobacter sp. CAN_A214]|uniref:Hpt domain-containing protein n=1 Tax=Arthrobacter sp. CAN_A214 TaxID=2787720 RepID=UPI0018C9A985